MYVCASVCVTVCQCVCVTVCVSACAHTHERAVELTWHDLQTVRRIVSDSNFGWYGVGEHKRSHAAGELYRKGTRQRQRDPPP